MDTSTDSAPAASTPNAPRAPSARFPSEKNQRMGRALALAGIPITALLAGLGWYYLESEFLYHWIGFAAVWAAISLAFGATRGRVDISDSTFVVRCSVFDKPRTIQFDKDCEIELDENELPDGKAVEWHVCLKKGDSCDILVRKVEGQLTMRNLAEALCKNTGLPLYDASSDPAVRLEATDLDLPFQVRARKYPQYDVQADKGARTVGIDIDSPGEAATRFSWHYLARTGIRLVGAITLVLCALWVVGEEEGKLFLWIGYWGVLVIAALGGLSMLCLALFRTRVVLDSTKISVVHLVWRIPIWKVSVVTTEVEDVRVIHRSVAVISDRGILKFRTRISGDADESNARWMANEVRSYLLARSAQGA